ncbi:MAG: HEAT repeat domain-containing protein [Planctomycetaceae bacterium]
MVRSLSILLALTALAPHIVVAAEIVLDSPMDGDPSFELPGTVKTLSPELKELWFRVLDGPESELTMRAAEAIAAVRRDGFDDMNDATPHLTRVLAKQDLTLPVRLSIARALVALDARQAAPELHRQAQRGERELRQVIDPALAEWRFEPAREEWLENLEDEATPYELLRLAVRCLGTLREPAASSRLQTLAQSAETPATIRLEAARAIGNIESDGLEEFAAKLAADMSPRGIVDRLVAVSVLRQHRSDRTTEILKELALDDEPTVAAKALQWLLETDPALVLPLTEKVLANGDANVRRLGAQALVEVPSPEGVASLGPLLDDPHPDVRRYVRDSLFTLAAQPELDDPVREAGMQALGLDSWRALEQASLLLGALDHEVAADRLLVLLEQPRPEVMVASAWALRRLALPDTLAPMLEFAKRQTERIEKDPAIAGANEQVAQIFQAFGQMTYMPADALMRKFVPKSAVLGEVSRTAAIWALGHLHAGRPDAALVSELESRIQDVASMPPEVEPVRGMSAITLGRMEAKDALSTLRMYDVPSGAAEFVGAASNWAITRMTGEVYPKANARIISDSGWFLEPLPAK